MVRRPPRSTRTGPTLSLHDALPIVEQAFARRIVARPLDQRAHRVGDMIGHDHLAVWSQFTLVVAHRPAFTVAIMRSEEHTSELQSLMRISYAVFCLKKKRNQNAHMKDQLHHTDATL